MENTGLVKRMSDVWVSVSINASITYHFYNHIHCLVFVDIVVVIVFVDVVVSNRITQSR